MTYQPRCGTRRFVDAPMMCGEDKARRCADGENVQNSYLRLVSTLGPGKGAV
jgi:hypothetical protein